MRVLRNDQNLGFPAGVNRGIGEARAQVLALANNDVVVTPGWLSRLARCLADPDIGLAGAVTNRIGNEAEIEASYRTYGELLAFAEERARLNAGVVRDLGTATMFCLAMRREVWERLGPLDEEFGLGTLEDDDYSARVRAPGSGSSAPKTHLSTTSARRPSESWSRLGSMTGSCARIAAATKKSGAGRGDRTSDGRATTTTLCAVTSGRWSSEPSRSGLPWRS